MIKAAAFSAPNVTTVEKCANRIYDRNEDGDMDITDSPIQLQNLYNRKSNTYAERIIFAYVTTADLRLDLLEKVRNLAKSKSQIILGLSYQMKIYLKVLDYGKRIFLQVWKDTILLQCCF